MIRRLPPVLLALALGGGCSHAPPPAPPSPAVAYYAAKAAYAALLRPAAAYRLQCGAKPEGLRHGCDAVVAVLRDAVTVADGYDAVARAALTSGDAALAAGAVAGLERVRDELQRRLVAAGIAVAGTP